MEHTMVDSWVARVMAPAMAPAMAPTDTRPLASTSSGAMLAHDGGRAPLTKRVEEAQAADDMEPLLLLAIQTEEGKPPNEWRRANVDALSQIACSHYHSVALGKDGTTFSWGRGPYGVLGHGSEDDEPCARPIAALKGERVQSVAAGPYNSAALTADGKVLLWGWHPLATLEEGMIHETFHSTPVRVAVPLRVLLRVRVRLLVAVPVAVLEPTAPGGSYVHDSTASLPPVSAPLYAPTSTCTVRCVSGDTTTADA